MMDEFAFIPYQLPPYWPEGVSGRVFPPNLRGLHTVQHIKNIMEHLIVIVIVVCSNKFMTNVCTVDAYEIKSPSSRLLLRMHCIKQNRLAISGSCKALEGLPSKVSR